MNHPYEGNNDYQFWKRTISPNHRSSFNPVTNTKFLINKDSKIATMGSCFAQHLTKWLIKNKLNFFYDLSDKYYANDKSSDCLFSANYGNIYTVSQGLQLLKAAYGLMTLSDEIWFDADQFVRDPLRPLAPGCIFKTQNEMLTSRQFLWSSIRNIFENFDVLIFTLGLTETWIRKTDNAILPSAPGVIAGTYCTMNYDFVNYDYNQTIDQIDCFFRFIKSLNSNAKIILTVSPVPLAATHENRHVAVSNMASKAILRAVADYAYKHYDYVDYFPSFEIFYNPGIGHQYFGTDQRSILSNGVDHVMRIFNDNFIESKNERHLNLINPEIIAESYFDVICDEDLM